MFGFLTPVGKEVLGPLTNAAAAEMFWRTLPRDDPVAAQKSVCAALADPVALGSPGMDELRALLALDQRAGMLVDRLLVNCVIRNPQSPSLKTQSFQAAFELCRSFGQTHGQFLRSMRDRSARWREYLPYVALRLFQHRQMELMLRPFAVERSIWFSWKELHEAYRFAQSSELLHDELPINRRDSASALGTTLEREYIHVLLQELMNGGQFPPYEAFWVNQSIPRWSRSVVLASPSAPSSKPRFIVDLDGDAGLVRSDREVEGTVLGLDMAPVLESIRNEIALLRDTPSRPKKGSSLGRGRQLKVLNKLDVLCAPERPVIARRGERKPIALTFEVAVGLSQILDELRCTADGVAVTASQTAPMSERGTATAVGVQAEEPLGGSTVTQWPTSAGNAGRSQLTMVDRSDSGCRLHGPTLGTNPIIPGALIAFREDAASPWTLAVVRRVKKRLAGKRIEIGAEFLGRDPRRIIFDSATESGAAKPATGVPARFAALYLPESTRYPVLPLRTLILPSCGLAPEDCLSVRSRTDGGTVQLKEPLEEQSDFIWSPFEILDRWLRDEPASLEETSKAQ